ncbi:hypothetical protein ACMU6081_18725 [Achromobacter mucicolens]|uniref:Uncharacterized protein n=1 Tax=Achromobacter mucicolens TaxID=1389922 RepID=A0ABM8LLT7_9BURK|nr:hypothetical protein LMG3415_05644 [Achromobacter mucicolens]
MPRVRGIGRRCRLSPPQPQIPHSSPMLKFLEDVFDIVLSILNVLDRNGDL